MRALRSSRTAFYLKHVPCSRFAGRSGRPPNITETLAGGRLRKHHHRRAQNVHSFKSVNATLLPHLCVMHDDVMQPAPG